MDDQCLELIFLSVYHGNPVFNVCNYRNTRCIILKLPVTTKYFVNIRIHLSRTLQIMKASFRLGAGEFDYFKQSRNLMLIFTPGFQRLHGVSLLSCRNVNIRRLGFIDVKAGGQK